jgi:hypothetical protein
MANLLVDIDGTICDDVPNEESHLFIEAKPYDNAAESLHDLIKSGHSLTYFTSREEKDRNTTIKWLKLHNFPEACLIMDKPRGGEYFWIDNHKVQGIRYYGSVNEHKWGIGFLNYIKKVIKNAVSYG